MVIAQLLHTDEPVRDCLSKSIRLGGAPGGRTVE
jgi:hypothetical protein